MMMAPQVVGVLLKKPGQQQPSAGLHPRIPPLDPQETKIRGELYVEDLSERCFVSIRMGYLWVEGTPMRLALRALNLRQAPPSICQPHALALGFTLSNSQGDSLATFWADTEPIWWSWVRAIAAQIVRQTPFRAQRCLNFLEILTTCPRGPCPLPDSPTDQRRRSRSELRCWPTNDLTVEKISNDCHTSSILEESRRRARSELRGWSSSNSSDEDLIGSNGVAVLSVINGKNQTNMLMQTRAWGCSESSEGSDDSLPWGAGLCRSSVDSVDSAISIPEATTREQRMQRYKEARRRENEARRKQVLEEDARRRKAKAAAEENNNDILHARSPKLRATRLFANDNEDDSSPLSSPKESPVSRLTSSPYRIEQTSVTVERLPPVKPFNDVSATVRFEDTRHHEPDDNRNNNNNARTNQHNTNLTNGTTKPAGILRTDTSERRSRARERRSVRERSTLLSLPTIGNGNINVETLKERKERLNAGATPIRFPDIAMDCTDGGRSARAAAMTTSLSILRDPPCEEDVARLLERCQRVDHYVPVREKLTLFESLSRMGGRLARSTEDLGRSSSNPSPRGKQRARSLHDLNRGGAKSVPVREMCRFFENGQPETPVMVMAKKEVARSRYSDFGLTNGSRSLSTWKDPPKNPNAPCIRTSTRRKHYAK
ncbi:uncharacterized protein LOC100678782 [Nasonia vitripennis]|uniref:Uncharacterized protein n=1 Tax=Nasonia vitripennis TaxID=7425 RepID=A0A7M7TAK6_NASVI|nr:uncharacterized protein LOC100678782 [Nasonia vitripennis]